jgi:hypothetical protein
MTAPAFLPPKQMYRKDEKISAFSVVPLNKVQGATIDVQRNE